MITYLQNKINPYIPGFNQSNIQRFVAGATGLCSYWLSNSLPLAILSVGASYGLQKWLMPEQKEPISPSQSIPFRKSPHEPVLLDESVLLSERESSAGIESVSQYSQPERLRSSFCSSVFWAFFSNDPACLDELPKAIVRRLDEKVLFNVKSTDLKSSSFPMYSIQQICKKYDPIKVQDLRRLEDDLQKLENIGFPQEMNAGKAKELLSLLQLYFLIQGFQKLGREQSIKMVTQTTSRSYVNRMEKMALRVNSTKNLKSNDQILQILGNLIFSDSSYEKTISTKNGQIKTWGNLTLSLTKDKTISKILDEELKETPVPSLPPLLALTMKNVKNHTNFGETKLTLFNAPGKIAHYELVGFLNHRSDKKSYCATWAYNRQWYFGSDVNKEAYKIDTSEIRERASNAKLFFYRQV